MSDALGVIEFSSIPSGYRIFNRILKDVCISVRQDRIIAPGKFIIMIEGSYAGVNHALEYAVNNDSAGILDYAIIGNLHPQLGMFLDGRRGSVCGLSDLGLVETDTVCCGIELMNRLLHGTEITLGAINYGVEMYGRCLLSFSGNISSIRTALELAGSGELISNPEEEIFRSIAGE